MLIVVLLNTKLNIRKIESGIKAKIIVNINHWAIYFFNNPPLFCSKIDMLFNELYFKSHLTSQFIFW